MLSENDRKNLLGNLDRNRVLLVTGAGFSCEAKNITGAKLPVGSQLAMKLWNHLYDNDEYDGRTTLKTLYGAALNHRKGKESLRQFFKTQLHVTEFPAWYRDVHRWFWRRIFTFNADDLLETVYRSSGISLETIVAPASYSDRDAFLRTMQYIKLHGCINNNSDLTFGPREYGIRAAARTDIWYLHFVEDYATMPTIFVGTELDEPIFWQYVESRGQDASQGSKLRRPKCFIISPTISKPNEDLLMQFNIISVRQTARDFFKWLSEQQVVRSREDVLRLIDPELEPALRASELGASAVEANKAEYFLSLFRVPVRPTNSRRSSMFLLGAPPSWDDIANDIDAHRIVADKLTTAVADALKNEDLDIVVVSSPAGGGKSTLCKRVALNLVDDGISVYFSDGTNRPDPARVAAYLLDLQHQSVLFIDNAGDDFHLIEELWEKIRDIRFRPLIVIAARANDVAYKGHDLARGGARILDFGIPDLCDEDIDAIIRTLEAHDLLGTLRDKSHAERTAVFKAKARKQILVAMREATSGRGFDEILRDEFETLQPASAKLLYLVTALASDGAYGLSVQHMITAMNLQPNETIALVQQSLRGILVQPEFDASVYFIRHPAIASFVIANAPREQLADAFTALLISISTFLPQGNQRRFSRAFRLYRSLLSHARMRSTFPEGARLPRQIYEGIKDYYRDDGHYWLHYASYEIEHGGEIALAENYLAQAQAILGEHRQIDTAMAHLLFRKALTSQNASEANKLADEALGILRAHMADSKKVSLHALHLFGSQMIEYIWKWTPTTERSAAFRQVGIELRRSAPEQLLAEAELARVLKEIKQAELETTVRR
jgi:SIR2-like domain/Holliday junction DNA helicase RuvB P-loop domain